MAKRAAKSTAGTEQPLPNKAGATPAPLPGVLKTTTTTLEAGTVLHRAHLEKYAADQFNPGVQGNARFSPILDVEGAPIPTLYGGVTKECALMETVFHDVPFAPGVKMLDKNKLVGQVHSTLEITEDLGLLDLSSVALRKLGITRKELIDTEKSEYPATRQWAEELHRQCPQAQGLSWVSRQDDTARAVVLFGDRIAPEVLRPLGKSLSLIDDASTYDDVLDLAARLDVLIVPGN